MKVQRVLVCGGTHGNELIGVYLVEKFSKHPELVRKPSFETLTLKGNPKAVAACTRYVDKDLNRCFNQAEIKPSPHAYELQRATEIRTQFSPTGPDALDVIIDLHSTTANMGLTLILDHIDGFSLQLAAHISAIYPALNIYSSSTSGRNRDALRSVAKCGICIEVGPLAHGTLQANLFQQTEALINSILDYLDQYNRNNIAANKPSLAVYQYLCSIDYPRDSNDKIQAMIHPQRQYQDYKPLNPGDPIFLTFDGETIPYQGESTVYPVFINEASYYEKGIAMCLTEKNKARLE